MSERYRPEEYESLEDFLFRRFEEFEYRLREISTSLTEDEYKAMAEAQLDSFLLDISPEVNGAYKSGKRRIKAIDRELKEAYAHRDQLRATYRGCSLHKDDKFPYYNAAMYGILGGSMIVVFAYSLRIVLPEIPSWLSIQSLVALGPSFLVAGLYQKCKLRSRFLKCLHIIGVCVSVTMAVSVGVARAIALSSVSSSGSFLSSTSASWSEQVLLPISSGLAFATMVGTEIIYSSTNLIAVKQYFESRSDIDKLSRDLDTAAQAVEELEVQSCVLNQRLKQIKQFSDFAEKWREAKLHELLNKDSMGTGMPLI